MSPLPNAQHTPFKIIFSFIFLFLLLNTSPAQEYELLQEAQFSELPNLELPRGIIDVFQDKEGFLWIGTYSGLCKYDGNTTKLYEYDPEKPDGLAGNWISDIQQDEAGDLWLGIFGVGLQRFNPKTETFRLFKPIAGDTTQLLSELVRDILIDERGWIWVTTQKGLSKYMPEKNQFKSYKEIQNVAKDSSGEIWGANSKNGVYKYSIDKDTFELFYEQKGIQGWRHFDFIGDELVIPNHENNLVFFNPDKKDWRVFSSNKKQSIFAISQIAPQKLLISRKYGGMEIFDLDKEIFHPVQLNQYTSEILFNPYTFVIQQYNDQILVGGEQIGFLKIEQENKQHFQLNQNGRVKNLSYFSLYPIEENQIGISNKLLLNTKKGRLQNITEIYPSLKRIETNHTMFSSDERYIDENEEHWILLIDRKVKESYQIFHFDPDSKSLTKIGSIDKKHGAASGGIVRDNNGDFWIGSWSRLIKFNTETQTHEVIKTNLKDSLSTIQIGGTRNLFKDKDGDIWIGTQDGLYQYDFNHQEMKLHLYDPQNKNSLSNNGVTNIKQDHKGIIWIGTFTGLNAYDKSTGQFTRFTKKNGLIDAAIQAIEFDDGHHIWAATNHGIFRLNPKTKEVDNFDTSNGLLNSAFEEHVSTKLNNGKLVFGGDRGFDIIDPSKIKKNQHIPPIKITGLSIFNQEVNINGADSILKQHITYTNEITLNYDQNIFSLKYAALEFTNSEKNQYAYQLVGFDKDWHFVGNKSEATFTNLDPGTYTFKVKGSNNDGIWNEEGASLKINILPPWWLTWWAKTLLGLLILGILYGFRRAELKKQEQQLNIEKAKVEHERKTSEQLRRVDKLKDEFLANTSHELRTPLNGIIGITESLEDGIAGPLPAKALTNLGIIKSSGKRLANLVNDILDFSQLKNNQLTLQSGAIDLHSAVSVVISLSNPLIKNKEVELVNKIPRDLVLVNADENRLQQILHNLIGNAIKFTELGKVEISANQKENQVEVCISDTGIGIPQDKQEQIFESFQQADGSTAREYGGTGLGLSVTKQLVELHEGRIWLNSELGKGTEFYFTLPMSSEERTATSTIKAPLLKGVVDQPVANITEAPLVEAGVNNEWNRVLIVDDEPVNLQVLNNHLSLHQYQVTQANDGLEALEIIRQEEPFDIIILDVMMPKMSGYQVCQELRKIYPPTQLPVVMLTAKNRVADLMDGFSSGANDYLIKPFSKDELLTRIKTHLELAQITKSYGRFVPINFLELLGKDSIIDARLGDQVKQEMTVLFSDIRGYTTLSEKMTPEENFQFINAYLSRMGPLIQNNNGFVSQYMGDGIMALFRISPEDALIAAIEMQQAVYLYNKDRKLKNRKPIKIGIGLHVGDLMLGVIGDKNRNDTGVISDVVNISSRLEGLTKVFAASILISDTVLKRIDNPERFEFRYLGKIQVKGRKLETGVYECINGDIAQTADLKRQTMKDFEAGMDHYFNKNFTEAASTFKSILKIHPEDVATKFYFENSAKLMMSGVEESWTGVEKMISK